MVVCVLYSSVCVPVCVNVCACMDLFVCVRRCLWVDLSRPSPSVPVPSHLYSLSTCTLANRETKRANSPERFHCAVKLLPLQCNKLFSLTCSFLPVPLYLSITPHVLPLCQHLPLQPCILSHQAETGERTR